MSKRQLKLGSLFDGSGGFPLAGSLCGIKPCWAAEVEPYPIAVTRSRFPNMKHLGSVTDVRGGEIEPVDIITFGSPCQDLSVAGKRAGLKHESNGDEETTRSGLFMEAVRIIKEMREATNGLYPRIALWENVPGAFSSNKGEDFRIVLEELIKVVEPAAVMPPVPQSGWPYADSYSGEGWSLSYRTYDAQYWGVPQRRRRIYLVADFRGGCAGKISFERQGLRGHSAKSGAAGEGTAGDAEDGPGANDRDGAAYGFMHQLSGVEAQYELSPTVLAAAGESGNNKPCVAYTIEPGIAAREGGHIYEGVAGTLRANAGDNQLAVVQPIAVATQQGGAEISENGICPTITAAAGMSGNNQPWICKPMAFTQNQRDEIRDLGDKAGCLQAEPGMKQQTFIIDSIGGQAERGWEGDVAPTLKASHYKFPPCVTVAAGFKPNQGSKAMGIGWEEEISPTLLAGQEPAVCIQECLPFDTTQVTSPQNGNNPKWGDPCHPLAAQGHPPTVICKTWDARGNGDGEVVSTITGDHENRITDYTSVVVEESPVICLQGNGIDRADTAGCNGKGWKEDVCYTLNTIDRPAVVYAIDQQGGKGGANFAENVMPTICADSHGTPHAVAYTDAMNVHGESISGTLLARDYKGPGRWDSLDKVVAYGIDCRNMNEYEELYPTLQAKPNGGQSLNFSGAVRTNSDREDETMIRYIVRRLTPTECARLQGFPDKWGHPDPKTDFSDEEYRFWLDVRNTHAAINGKATKEYTKEQMLTWYNKLHTDSSEYKMWGNGIALPTALYLMEGIAELIGEEETE